MSAVSAKKGELDMPYRIPRLEEAERILRKAHRFLDPTLTGCDICAFFGGPTRVQHEAYHVDVDYDEEGKRIAVATSNPECPYCNEFDLAGTLPDRAAASGLPR
jgi:hypothetical protein